MVGHSESDIAAAAHAAYKKWQTWGVQHAHNALTPIKADILVATGDNARTMEGAAECVSRPRAGAAPS